jgi:hypothetical protein
MTSIDQLTIEAGHKTPFISLKHDGVFQIKGKSIPENSVEFYNPVFTWIDTYIKSPKPVTEITIHLEYFNTSSSKCLLDLFRRLEKLHNAGSKVSVNWLFEEEDEDMQEAGDDYQSIVKLPFNISKIG